MSEHDGPEDGTAATTEVVAVTRAHGPRGGSGVLTTSEHDGPGDDKAATTQAAGLSGAHGPHGGLEVSTSGAGHNGPKALGLSGGGISAKASSTM
jgi:hypothetical protein